MPSVDPRLETSLGQVSHAVHSPIAELEISNEKVSPTMAQGRVVCVTATNPFYVNLSIHAP